METFCGITTDGMLDYLTAIYKLSNDLQFGSVKVTTSMLAEKMHVSPAAASSMLKRLEESGFIDRSHNDGIRLSEQGRLAAVQMIRRHRLLEVFLLQVLGFTWDQVDVEAHRLEHAVSSAFEDRMDELCAYPTHCPHGDPIPSKDGVMPIEKLHLLNSMDLGQEGTIRRVASDDALVLRYLGQRSIIPGSQVKLVTKEPFNGPVTLEIAKNNTSNINMSSIDTNNRDMDSTDTNHNNKNNIDTNNSNKNHVNKNGTGLDSFTQILGAELAARIWVALPLPI